MKFEEKGDVIYKFSANNKPVAELAPGETVVVETADCFSIAENDAIIPKTSSLNLVEQWGGRAQWGNSAGCRA